MSLIETKFVIITGASKGLGSELAINISKKGVFLLLIARDLNALEFVAEKCRQKGAIVETLIADLSLHNFSVLFSKKLMEVGPTKIDVAYLFNNASIIEPIKRLVNTDFNEQQNLINVNLVAPIFLTSEFLRFIQKSNPKESFIINVSSGVSLKPIEGWSLYCTSKAGINMLTASVAEETSMWVNKVYSVSINPGALNTNMQYTIRNSENEESPISEKFRQLYNDGSLRDPNFAANKILEIVKNKTFPNGEFIDFNLLY